MDINDFLDMILQAGPVQERASVHTRIPTNIAGSLLSLFLARGGELDDQWYLEGYTSNLTMCYKRKHVAVMQIHHTYIDAMGHRHPAGWSDNEKAHGVDFTYYMPHDHMHVTSRAAL